MSNRRVKSLALAEDEYDDYDDDDDYGNGETAGDDGLSAQDKEDLRKSRWMC